MYYNFEMSKNAHLWQRDKLAALGIRLCLSGYLFNTLAASPYRAFDFNANAVQDPRILCVCGAQLKTSRRTMAVGGYRAGSSLGHFSHSFVPLN